MVRPLVVDLFCGAGGAGEGYRRAGFDVVGVDIYEHDYRPGHFVLADALDVLRRLARDPRVYGRRPALVHASPPCQRYSTATGSKARDKHPDLVGMVGGALHATGIPYVIENVPQAPLRKDLMLCGSMFGHLMVRRHRVFELGGFTVDQPRCRHRAQGTPVGVYGQHPDRRPYLRPDGTRRGVKATSDQEGCEAMGIDWPILWADLVEAIPPAYTEHIGRNFLAAARDQAAA